MHKSVSGPKQGYMLARPGTSDADFEAINACFQAPLEGASAFEFMSLRIPVCQARFSVGGAVASRRVVEAVV